MLVPPCCERDNRDLPLLLRPAVMHTRHDGTIAARTIGHHQSTVTAGRVLVHFVHAAGRVSTTEHADAAAVLATASDFSCLPVFVPL